MRFIEIENASRLQVRQSENGNFYIYLFEDLDDDDTVREHQDSKWQILAYDSKKGGRTPNLKNRFHGSPCSRCGGTLRYKKWNNCISCHQQRSKGAFYMEAIGDKQLALEMFMSGERISKIQQKLRAPRDVVLGFIGIRVPKNGKTKNKKAQKNQIDWVEINQQARRIHEAATHGGKD